MGPPLRLLHRKAPSYHPSWGADTPSEGGPHFCMLDSPRCVSLNLSNQPGNEAALQAENAAHTPPPPSGSWGRPKATDGSYFPVGRRGTNPCGSHPMPG